MTEWVVTLVGGERFDEVEAEVYERVMHAGQWRHEFRSRPPGMSRWWPEDRVLLVQLRDGHLLEQVWPEKA